MRKFSLVIFPNFFFALYAAESIRDPFFFPEMMSEEKLVVQHTQVEVAEKKEDIETTQWKIIKQLEDGTALIKKQDGSMCKIKI